MRTTRKLRLETLESRIAIAHNSPSDLPSGAAISAGQQPAIVQESSEGIPAGFRVGARLSRHVSSSARPLGLARRYVVVRAG